MGLLPPKDGKFSLLKIYVLSRLIRFASSLLFATTNHIERLDPALSRPGRMDVWINFKNATKWQAEEIFRNFFPCKPSDIPTLPTSRGETAGPKERSRRRPNAQVLNEDELADLAKRFADAVPEDEMSVSLERGLRFCAWADKLVQVAALQGYLLKNKSRPKEAVDEVAQWYLLPAIENADRLTLPLTNAGSSMSARYGKKCKRRGKRSVTGTLSLKFRHGLTRSLLPA